MFGYLLTTTTTTTTAYIKRGITSDGAGWEWAGVGGREWVREGTGGEWEVGGKSIKSAATKERKC